MLQSSGRLFCIDPTSPQLSTHVRAGEWQAPLSTITCLIWGFHECKSPFAFQGHVLHQKSSNNKWAVGGHFVFLLYRPNCLVF